MGWLWCAAVVVVVVLVPPAAPCTCYPRHPQQHVCDADFVVFARVRRLTTTPDDQLAYKVRVKRITKGSEKVELIMQKGLIYTVPSTCQAVLKERVSHMITGTVVAGKPWVNLCNLAAPVRSLTPKMKKGFRLLYQSGCDCPIMSCHFWEECPRASFFCAWETSQQKVDCQGRHSMCLRGPDGGCDWLQGRLYRKCMKTLHYRRNNTDINNTQDNNINRDIYELPTHRKVPRFPYKRTRLGRLPGPRRVRPRRPLHPRRKYSKIGYIPKNG